MTQEVKEITSEALEAAYRSLTPSQNGFTQDLMASNVIIPTLDLTAAAQGTTTPAFLQRAINFGNANVFNVNNALVNVISTAGFWQVTGTSNLALNVAATVGSAFYLTDGASSKQIYGLSKNNATSFTEFFGESFEFVIFLRSGDILQCQTSVGAQAIGSYRQIADVNGNLVYPTGFTPQ